MPAIPLGEANYRRSGLPPVSLSNMYFENAPSSLEDQVSLFPRPRLKAFAQAGPGPIMGLYRKGGVLAAVGLSGSIIAKSGPELYRVTQAGQPGVGTATHIGTVDGGFRMSAEGNPSAVVLTCGATPWTTDGTTVSPIAFPDGNIVSAVDSLNGYFLFASAFGRYYWSAVGGTTVDALDFATAESQPDELLTLKVVGDELWLLGRLSVEVWQPTGDLDLPFQRINGRIFGIGVTCRETVQKLNVNGLDTICWLGTDRRVYRTDPNPRRISDEGLEEVIQGLTLSTVPADTNPYAETASWNGHDFYVLTVPNVGSFAYDLLTGKWADWSSHGHPVFRASVSATGPNSQPLLGDLYSNQIFEMVVTDPTDAGDPVLFEFTGLLEVPSAPQRLDNVSLDLATGTTSDPQADPMMSLDTSEDEGATWLEAGLQSLGRMGQRRTRVAWTRLGLLRRPGRIFRWRSTEPVTVRKSKYNEGLR